MWDCGVVAFFHPQLPRPLGFLLDDSLVVQKQSFLPFYPPPRAPPTLPQLMGQPFCFIFPGASHLLVYCQTLFAHLQPLSGFVPCVSNSSVQLSSDHVFPASHQQLEIP